MEKFSTFIPITRVYEPGELKGGGFDDVMIVEGYATTGAVDLKEQIVDPEFIRAALPEYIRWGNIRDSHRPDRPIGTLVEGGAEIDAIGLKVAIKVVDEEAQKKCRHGVFKGMSVGLDNVFIKPHSKAKKGMMTFRPDGLPARIVEISLTDRPINPEAVFTAFRGNLEGVIEQNDLVRPPSAFPDGVEVKIVRSFEEPPAPTPAASPEVEKVEPLSVPTPEPASPAVPAIPAEPATPAATPEIEAEKAAKKSEEVKAFRTQLTQEATALIDGAGQDLTPEQKAKFAAAFVSEGMKKKGYAPEAAKADAYEPPGFAEMWAGHEIAEKLPEMMDTLKSAIYNAVWSDGGFDDKAGRMRSSLEAFISAVLKPLTELPATKLLRAQESVKKSMEAQLEVKLSPEAQKAYDALRGEVSTLQKEIDGFKNQLAPPKAIKYAGGGGPEVTGDPKKPAEQPATGGLTYDEAVKVQEHLASHPSDEARMLASRAGPKLLLAFLTKGLKIEEKK